MSLGVFQDKASLSSQPNSVAGTELAVEHMVSAESSGILNTSAEAKSLSSHTRRAQSYAVMATMEVMRFPTPF